MADFLTRLAERTLGMAAVVQPLITSAFATEPADQVPDLEHDEEVPASPGDLYRAESPSAVERPPARDTPMDASQDLAIFEREEHGTNARITSPHPSGPPEVSPGPYHPARTSTSEREITSAQEDQHSNALTTPQASRRMHDAAGDDLFEGNIVSGGVRTGIEDQQYPSRAPARHLQTPPEMHHGTEADPALSARAAPAERPKNVTIAQKQEERRNVAFSVSGRSQTVFDEPVLPEKPELLHPSGSSLTRHGVNAVPPRPVLSENLPLGPPLAEGELGTRHHTEADPTPSAWDAPAERLQDATIAQKQKERRNVAPAVKGRSQTIPEESEQLHPARTGETRQDITNRVWAFSDPAQGSTPASPSSPRTQVSSDTNEETLSSEGIRDRPEALDAPRGAPQMIRPRMKSYVERGRQEPRVDAPESSAPTVRVAIGRIEVRTITPPPRPLVQQTTPARPALALSLDDYLKQRNGEQR